LDERLPDKKISTKLNLSENVSTAAFLVSSFVQIKIKIYFEHTGKDLAKPS